MICPVQGLEKCEYTLRRNTSHLVRSHRYSIRDFTRSSKISSGRVSIAYLRDVAQVSVNEDSPVIRHRLSDLGR